MSNEKTDDVIGLNDWVRESYDRSVRKGFHETKRSFLEAAALLHSEISEAVEDEREGNTNTYFVCKNKDCGFYNQGTAETCHGCKQLAKPCGLPSELADVFIRLCDTAGALGIDLEHEVKLKSAYNETRPHKHGKKI